MKPKIFHRCRKLLRRRDREGFDGSTRYEETASMKLIAEFGNRDFDCRETSGNFIFSITFETNELTDKNGQDKIAQQLIGQ